jgi:hypothetical protein
VADDGGVSVTSNGGRSFRRHMLPIAQIYHVRALASDVSRGADFAPTAQQLAVAELLESRLDEVGERLEALLSGPVAAFNLRLGRAALPAFVVAARAGGP